MQILWAPHQTEWFTTMGNVEFRLFNGIVSPPRLYMRYVDDIFAVFDKDTAIDPFFHELESAAP